eukprot:TRINITY_DN51198_c0_g2_i1.p1 TRINITY_DN51198_c0_g2~~TRINITY_DN51198_c0_g2_i1.p1  ORF type:complete len:384 (-),score=90.14 TRINITY_DN51198_c0_g2_i1:16-1167(-)
MALVPGPVAVSGHGPGLVQPRHARVLGGLQPRLRSRFSFREQFHADASVIALSGCAAGVAASLCRPGSMSSASSSRGRRKPRLAATVTEGAAVPTASVASAAEEPELQYILPVGPTCPFRSREMEQRNVDQEMAAAIMKAQIGAGKFQVMMQSFAAGIPPDKGQARDVGQQMSDRAQELKRILDTLQTSRDFQAIETFYAMETTAELKQITSSRAVQRLLQWQADGLLAYSKGLPMPPPPMGLQQQVQAGSAGLQASGGGGILERILPFTEEDFESALNKDQVPLLKAEYERLQEDHEELIRQGETYGEQENIGKLSFLDNMDAILERWEEFMLAAAKAGLEPGLLFSKTSSEYLKRAGLAPIGYKDLVREVLNRMRADVQRG